MLLIPFSKKKSISERIYKGNSWFTNTIGANSAQQSKAVPWVDNALYHPLQNNKQISGIEIWFSLYCCRNLRNQ